ncbi:LysR family transcriptional regulator [Pseudotabrizicola alkalilacus]|uniref:LysR family transcriptional regulator n=1 Tax=Pseudotabrizicola alkalilacus TaxID=2305252 RepID=A0A411YWU3_9RHOB|nr:LysR family transcriptional regulator [Pseudotabrizicola alkalilacus]RGP35272.1 LysR family transcriptional regulator [Pseudotabrizicola alkalilacus]
MIAPRRFLPSVSSLLALEAVDRLGTAIAAANELSLTHSAISRQLKALQEQIGVALLQRDGKGLALTPAGKEYAASSREYLQHLARASLKIRAAGDQTSLNLAVLPAFGTHWLLPRLRRFSAQHPEITVNLGTRLAPFDFSREPFDAAIHFGSENWPGVHYLSLATEEIIPSAAPDLVPGPLQPQQILAMPLLHLESRPGAWEDWFGRRGCDAGHLHGMLFDQFTHMAEAAALGFGVALLPRFLAEAEFRSGRLCPAVADFTTVDGRYFAVWPQICSPSRALQQFLRWLEQETSADTQ